MSRGATYRAARALTISGITRAGTSASWLRIERRPSMPRDALLTAIEAETGGLLHHLTERLATELGTDGHGNGRPAADSCIRADLGKIGLHESPPVLPT